MGGDLCVSSPGLGCGATFTASMRLTPFTPAEGAPSPKRHHGARGEAASSQSEGEAAPPRRRRSSVCSKAHKRSGVESGGVSVVTESSFGSKVAASRPHRLSSRRISRLSRASILSLRWGRDESKSTATTPGSHRSGDSFGRNSAGKGNTWSSPDDDGAGGSRRETAQPRVAVLAAEDDGACPLLLSAPVRSFARGSFLTPCIHVAGEHMSSRLQDKTSLTRIRPSCHNRPFAALCQRVLRLSLQLAQASSPLDAPSQAPA